MVVGSLVAWSLVAQQEPGLPLGGRAQVVLGQAYSLAVLVPGCLLVVAEALPWLAGWRLATEKP